MSIGAKFPKTDSGISVMSFWYIMDYFHVGIQKTIQIICIRNPGTGRSSRFNTNKNCLQYGGIFWSRLRSNVSFFTFTFS